MGADAKPRAMRRWPAIGALVTAASGLLLTGLAFASPAAAKPKPSSRVYNVRIEFEQDRLWDYYMESVGVECTSTTEGSGSDDARFVSKARFVVESIHKGVAGFGVQVLHARTGTMTHTFNGSDPSACATSYSDPTTGCGTTPSLTAFPTLSINENGTDYVLPGYFYDADLILLELAWDGTASVPEFNPCPYFDGSADAPDGQELPGDAYLDLTVPVYHKRLLAAKHTQSYFGSREIIGRENCGNIVYGCPEGVTYSGNASVRASVKVVFTPKRSAR
jgi:hypothetical protein